MDRGFGPARLWTWGWSSRFLWFFLIECVGLFFSSIAVADEEVILGLMYKTQDCWSTRLSFSFCHMPLSSQAISQALSCGQTKMHSAAQFTNNDNRE